MASNYNQKSSASGSRRQRSGSSSSRSSKARSGRASSSKSTSAYSSRGSTRATQNSSRSSTRRTSHNSSWSSPHRTSQNSSWSSPRRTSQNNSWSSTRYTSQNTTRNSQRRSSRSSTPSRSSRSSTPSRSYASTPLQYRTTSVRVGDLNQGSRAHRVQKSYRQYVIRVIAVIVLVIAVFAGGVFVYNSGLFTITNVSVKGVEHLTATEMTDLASVPSGTTLLRVDEEGIKSRLAEEAWVESVQVNRVFPDTLELVITERRIAAIVEVPADSAQTIETWAIASDGVWLMNIPSRNSREARSISSKIYEDADSSLRITSVPYGLKPEVGNHCSDENVNNALSIIDGLTTNLADQVKTVIAAGTETTTLILTNGIEIAFGTADDIREKERVCLQLMEEHEGSISYINVRVVDRPTWRSTD